jgi:hypothetical protein
MRHGLLVALLVLGACGCGTSRSDQHGGAGGGSGAGSGAGGSGGGPSSTGGTSGSGTGGSTVGTGGTGTGGTGTGGTGTGGGSGTGGAPAGSGGMAGAGSGGAGGSSGPGTGGTAGSGGGGGSAARACTRDLLRTTITAYFTALAAHSASTLPLADTVKFTENGRAMTLGQEGLWRTAGAVKHSQSALDVEICGSATHAVVPEGNVDIPVGLRLKLQNQRITEIETIAVRAGDYRLGGQTFASNTAAIIAANDMVGWEIPVAAAQRNARAELIAWIDKYFRMFPRGVCNTVNSCRRLENGYGTFNCRDGASCDPGQPTGQPAMTPRLLLADADTGIGVGMTMFMGNTDMHMFKMYGGQVYAVHAVLGGATSSGWD